MIIIGFLFLAVYIQSQNTETISVLSHPSYYVERSLLMMFLAGIAVLVGLGAAYLVAKRRKE